MLPVEWWDQFWSNLAVLGRRRRCADAHIKISANSRMNATLAPTPLHLLRFHTSPVTALARSNDNERIYSADSSGRAVVTSARSLRAITIWNPHSDSVLGIEEWDDEFILTSVDNLFFCMLGRVNFLWRHGRDNKLNVWKRLEEVPFTHQIGDSAHLADMQKPTLAYSMDVNALNFCRFSLLKESMGSTRIGGSSALLALPNLIDSTTVRGFVFLYKKYIVGPKDGLSGRHLVITFSGQNPCGHWPRVQDARRSNW